MPAGDFPFYPPLEAQWRPPNGITDAFERVVRAVAQERLEAMEKLTEVQLMEALRQALACGDFVKHVMVRDGGEGQYVDYIPFRECERLRARIRELEGTLTTLRSALDVRDYRD